MSTSVQLGDEMQTSCLHCGSVFRITSEQLEMARGQVRCSQCMQVFNALLTLENFSGEHDETQEASTDYPPPEIDAPKSTNSPAVPVPENHSVSLNEAMYGDNPVSNPSLKPMLWIAGIVLMIIIGVVQFVYYQRYQLISSTQYQQQILNLCQILPCDESRFNNLSQIQLIERNVFTHPTRDNALMVTGSFINEASFEQPVPSLMISLSDIQGNLIANRLFTAQEYLTDKSLQQLPPGKPVQFRLEIVDPGNEALTYEFEFAL